MNIAATIRDWTKAWYWRVPSSSGNLPSHYIRIDGYDCFIKVQTAAIGRILESAARACAEAMEAEESASQSATDLEPAATPSAE